MFFPRFILNGVLFWFSYACAAQVIELSPKPELTPEQVVQFQISALQHNDDPQPDSGIERTFRFASPSNKEITGPLEHFIQIVRAPAYLPLINSLSSKIVGVVMGDEHSEVAVEIQSSDGQQFRYLFVLTKQSSGDLAGCWMTDSVVPVKTDKSSQGETI